jgi:hypothetical protein
MNLLENSLIRRDNIAEVLKINGVAADQAALNMFKQQKNAWRY